MIGTRDEWLAARRELLEREKELTRRSDELARERRELPWVPVEKEYAFDAPGGRKALPDLFAGRAQLLVYHLMFGPDDDMACSGCSFTADSLDGAVIHLENRGVTFVAISRAPLEKLEAYKRRMGWSFPWVSSSPGDFNPDFGEFAPPSSQGMELHGLSAFALEDAAVYHTYSCFDRGTDVLNGTWQLLDRSPRGRGDDLEDWPRRHDEYEEAVHAG